MNIIQTGETNEPETVYEDSSFFHTSIFPKPYRYGTEKNVGPYVKLVHEMSRAHPNLVYLDQELMRARGTRDEKRGRSAVIEFSENKPVNHKHFNEPQQLEDHLRCRADRPRGRLFLLEDIATDYVELFGEFFTINPSFFARHLRATSWENSQRAANSPALPSMSDKDVSFSISYPEVLKVHNRELRMEKSLFCYCNVYRGIQMIRRKNFFDGAAIVRRLVSFWSRNYENGDWDALLLVDPPLGENVYSSYRIGIPISLGGWELFQGGYIDVLHTAGDEMGGETAGWIEAPPRTSMLDDIIYYWMRRSSPNSKPRSAVDSAFYTKKIAAATWMNTLEYIRKGISVLEWKLENGRADRLHTGLKEKYEDLDWLEDILSVLYDWKWNCALFSDLLDDDLIQLGIPIDDMRYLTESEQRETKDWIYIRLKLSMWKSRTKDLIDSALGSIQLVESKKSIDEARNSRLLATLGSVFLPLSLVASVLSIPGNSRLRIYFAVALPMAVLFFLSAQVILRRESTYLGKILRIAKWYE